MPHKGNCIRYNHNYYYNPLRVVHYHIIHGRHADHLVSNLINEIL